MGDNEPNASENVNRLIPVNLHAKHIVPVNITKLDGREITISVSQNKTRAR